MRVPQTSLGSSSFHWNLSNSKSLQVSRNCNIAIIYDHVTNMWNIHRESRNTRNTDDSLGSGTKLLLPSLSLGFRHEERETQFFYTDCSSIVSSQLTDPTNCTGLAQVRKINLLRLSQNLNSLLFSKIIKNPSPSLLGMTSFTSPILFPFCGFYFDICDCHILPARAWKPALMSAPTHAISQKVLSLTKPKDKIYKTKNGNIKKILPQLFNRISSVSRSILIMLLFGWSPFVLRFPTLSAPFPNFWGRVKCAN